MPYLITKNLNQALLSSLLIVFLTLAGCRDKSAKESQAAAPGNDSLFSKYALEKVKLPPGFAISIFAEVPNARSMCWGAKGTLFVGNKDGKSVYAVTDADGDGKAEQVYTLAKGLNSPNGVAFRNGSLYVAEISRILRFDNIESSLANPPAFQVVYDKLPTDGWHGWKFIAFGPDDKLYVPVGAPCNVCKKDDPVYASITRMNPDGTGFEVFASGIRNTVGFAWHPQTHALWFTDNGRDDMGDDMPSDELNMADKPGMNFGFPYCHQGDTPDPEFGKGHNCSEFTGPKVKLGAHVASLGCRFYTGSSFPQEYRNQLFIAEHGSWNRSTPSGHIVNVVSIKENGETESKPFATGWLDSAGGVTGRPVDVEVAKDGSLLVSDDYKGVIYRIYYKGK